MCLNREQEEEADQSDCDGDLTEEPCGPDIPDLEGADWEMSADRQAVSAETDDQVSPVLQSNSNLLSLAGWILICKIYTNPLISNNFSYLLYGMFDCYWLRVS